MKNLFKIVIEWCQYLNPIKIQSPLEILNKYYPINTLNSSDEECIGNDFERIIGKWK